MLLGWGPSAARGTGNTQGPGLHCSGKQGPHGPSTPKPEKPCPELRVDTPGALPRPSPMAPAAASPVAQRSPGTDSASAEKLLGWAAQDQPCRDKAPKAQPGQASPRVPHQVRLTSAPSHTGLWNRAERKPGMLFPGQGMGGGCSTPPWVSAPPSASRTTSLQDASFWKRVQTVPTDSDVDPASASAT